jgi:hypothetical protein
MFPYRDSRAVRIILFVFFALLAVYALFEARGLLYGPVIDLPEETIVVSDAFTTVKGRAERITELRLNGAQIAVTERGEFEEPFVLAPGSNHLILEARDARGRTTRKTLMVIYNPPTEAPPPGTNEGVIGDFP